MKPALLIDSLKLIACGFRRIRYAVGGLLAALLPAAALLAGNPAIPMDFFPDPKPRVWSDGRLYVYPSHDIAGRGGYCSDNYHVLSTADLVNWTDHGVSLRLQDTGVPDASALYASDCVYAGGKYHLYASTNNRKIVVLTSDSPSGPFTDPHIMEGINGIDPAVLIDDDGSAYFYWGQNDGVRCAKLKPNLYEIDKSTIKKPLSVAEHFFHEGSSVMKINGKYYYFYASTARDKRPTTLSYATSDSPQGPYIYGGVIIDNKGADPAVWNIHGRIAQFQSRWYVFYHRSTNGGVSQRQFCIEPITINSDGSIPEVGMTSRGAGDLLDASDIPVWQMCQMQGNARLQFKNGTWTLAKMNDGDVIWFRGYRFGEKVREVEVLVKANAPATLEIRDSDPNGMLLATIPVTPGSTKDFQAQTAAAAGNWKSLADFCVVYRGPSGAVELQRLSFGN